MVTEEDHPADARAFPDELGPEEYERLRAASETAAPLFELLGRSHAFDVLYEVASADEPLRFDELQDRIEVPSATLSTRLTQLVDAGLVERDSHDEIPPRVEYEATPRTMDLEPVYLHLVEWVERHDVDPIE